MTVRLTGLVPMADEEFGTIEDGAGLNAAGTALIVLFIISCALKSGRIVLSVALSVVVGLAATAAVGLMMVGALNLISVAFAVLFVGIGVDFGIQFSVRYRAERYKEPHFDKALAQAAAKAGRPLGACRGGDRRRLLLVSADRLSRRFRIGADCRHRHVHRIFRGDHGLAGLADFVAAAAGTGCRSAIKFLAPVDRFMANHRYAIVAGTLARGAGRNTFAPPSSFRFQSAELAQLQS